MNPNNQFPPAPNETPPPQTPDALLPQVNAPNTDDIFVVKQPEKKPLDKKSTSLVVVLAVLGGLALVAVLIFALIGSAGGLANDYRRLEAVQMKKIDVPLANLEPSAVINQRNLDEPLKQITQSEQSQPSLESVLFIGAWSDRYRDTETLQAASQKHYGQIKTYASQLKQLLAFDSAAQTIFNQEPNLAATINPADSFSIRSVSGSYEDFAKKIGDTASPPQIKKLKTDLAQLYKDKAGAYLAWATAVEQNNAAAATTAQQSVEATSGQALVLIDDQNYVDAFTPSYQKLVSDHKKLTRLLGQ